MKNILFPLLLAVILIGCNESNTTDNTMTNQEEQTQKEATPTDAKKTLKQELDDRKAKSAGKASKEKAEAYANGILSVEQSGILKSAKQKGDKAPDFALTNAVGAKVKLSDLLKNGPVVLTWYRGGWCPYCNITLHRLQEDLPAFKQEGAQLLALTPELPDKSMNTKEKNNLEFEILSDVGNKVARSYGVVFKLNDDVARMYNESFDLAGYNGDASSELPLAATYVIDKGGVIRYAFLDADYRNRAEPGEILEALRLLKEM